MDPNPSVPQTPPLPPPLEIPKTPPPEVEYEDQPGFHMQLFRDFVRLELLNGAVKDYSYADFTQAFLAFRGVLNEKEEAADSPLMKLPRNVYAIRNLKTRLTIGQYYPEGKQIVNYLGTKRESVVPNILVVTTLIKQKDFRYTLEAVKYWCTNRLYEQFDKEIYTSRSVASGIQYLPFSNTYEDGTLCYGNNSVTREFLANDLRAIRGYYDVLFNSPFNNDLGIRALHNTPDHGFSVASWYDHLAALAAENKPFPYATVGLK